MAQAAKAQVDPMAVAAPETAADADTQSLQASEFKISKGAYSVMPWAGIPETYHCNLCRVDTATDEAAMKMHIANKHPDYVEGIA